ncbi:unnamed protein product [Amoebophrya sp. A25]|nr:unnamed protein product [Amoebophrya sp. A25]|eukprot:GSA25T00001857001.1
MIQNNLSTMSSGQEKPFRDPLFCEKATACEPLSGKRPRLCNLSMPQRSARDHHQLPQQQSLRGLFCVETVRGCSRRASSSSAVQRQHRARTCGLGLTTFSSSSSSSDGALRGDASRRMWPHPRSAEKGDDEVSSPGSRLAGSVERTPRGTECGACHLDGQQVLAEAAEAPSASRRTLSSTSSSVSASPPAGTKRRRRRRRRKRAYRAHIVSCNCRDA